MQSNKILPGIRELTKVKPLQKMCIPAQPKKTQQNLRYNLKKFFLKHTAREPLATPIQRSKQNTSLICNLETASQ